LRTEWGRVGYNPKSQEEIFENKIDAILFFKKKFSEKTYNNWEERNDFRPQEGKYSMIKTEKGPDSSKEKKTTLNEEIDTLNKRNHLISQKIKDFPT
jgi:poly [ADP-ribose] polymerase 2/3/4